MAHGGARPGSGRKAGSATKLNEAAREKALCGGISPLDFLLNAMRDENRDFETRKDCAKAAAPYVHAKLASVEHSGVMDINLAAQKEQRDAAVAAALRADS